MVDVAANNLDPEALDKNGVLLQEERCVDDHTGKVAPVVHVGADLSTDFPVVVVVVVDYIA